MATLAERLREIARQIRGAGDWSDLHEPMDALEALAGEVEAECAKKPAR